MGKVLVLEEEEARKLEMGLCGWSETQRSYSEMGSVEKSSCCCFVCVDSDFGTIVPGMGCDSDAAEEIVQELQCRITSRGDPAHQLRQEATLRRIKFIESKLDRIVQHLTTTTAPKAKFMDQRETTKQDDVLTQNDREKLLEGTAVMSNNVGGHDYDPHTLYHMATF
jgi:hypothetical protein